MPNDRVQAERTVPITPAATPRFDTVDLLRGLSIVSVVLLHTWLRMHFAGFHLHFPPSPWLLYVLLRNGGHGVTLFFAISGFLITLTSIRRFGSLANMRPGVFYRIRFARIAPLLLTLLAILSILHLTHVEGFRIKGVTLPRALFSALTFHLNWLEAIHMHAYLPANWDVLWSLSVEEMFYLFFPLVSLAAFRLRRGPAAFIAILSLFVVLGPFARTVFTANDQWVDTSYLAGMDAIALGCLAALLTHHLSQRPSPRKATLLALQLLGIAMMALFMLFLPWHWLRPLYHAGLGETILATGACLVMLASVLRARPGRVWTLPLRWFGRHSYEVYLTHEFLVIAGTEVYAKLHRGPLALWFLAILLLTAPVGALTARFLSEPLNRRLRGAAPPR